MTNLLKQFGEKTSPTNINYSNNYNYNNYNNYNNDLTTNNYTNHCRSSVEDQYNASENKTASLPLGQEKENHIESNEGVRKLPDGWKYLKLDLFKNGLLKSGMPSYKLKSWISPKASATLELVSLLNTPWESGRMKYNVDDEKWQNDPHWQTVKSHYHKIKNIYDDVRSSKLAKTYKGAPTPIAVFKYTDGNDHGVDLVIKGQVYQYWFDTDLTDKQKLTNQIGTVKIGFQQRQMLDWEDLGL